MNKIEHIGIAVKNLEASNKLFARLLGVNHYKIEEVLSEGVTTSFFKAGPNKIELLEATNLDSPIAKLSLIHISEPTRLRRISYAVFCLKKKKKKTKK